LKVEIGPYVYGDSDRVVDIHIDDYDHWNADHTIGMIALPILKELQKHKEGAPYVDLEDVPEHLHPEAPVDPYGVDSTHFERWDYVLGEMIYAFDYLVNQRDMEAYETEPDSDGLFGESITQSSAEKMKEMGKRAQNGFELFGKYYQGLWS
jgi:hypothetical protein